jgi:hypothetical protein
MKSRKQTTMAMSLFNIVLAMRPTDRAGWKHLLESGDLELTEDRAAWLRALRMAAHRDRIMAVLGPRQRRANASARPTRAVSRPAPKNGTH